MPTPEVLPPQTTSGVSVEVASTPVMPPVQVPKKGSAKKPSKVDSFKDELWTIIFATPLVLVFVPYTRPAIEEGFRVISTSAPEWYIVVVCSLVVWASGHKGLVAFNLWRATKK